MIGEGLATGHLGRQRQRIVEELVLLLLCVCQSLSVVGPRLSKGTSQPRTAIAEEYQVDSVVGRSIDDERLDF